LLTPISQLLNNLKPAIPEKEGKTFYPRCTQRIISSSIIGQFSILR